MFLQVFYRALDPLNITVVDNIVGGSLVKLHYNATMELLREATNKNQCWHTWDVEVPKSALSTSIVDKKKRKQNEEREESMAKMMTKLNLLTKYVTGVPTKMVNVVLSKSYEDDKEMKKLDGEIKYLANYSGVPISSIQER